MSKNHNDFTDCFREIITLENFITAYDRTQLTQTKYNQESIIFGIDFINNIEKLRKEVIEGAYEPRGFNVFKVYEPKERVIAAPKLPDKIVQFAVHNVINADFERKFIYDSYACQKGKGTHAAADRIQHFLRKAKWKWGDDAWIIKADIKSFFYSIKHHILKKILAKKIKCEKTLQLLNVIIDNSINKIGLPLGNVTSQLLANIYLNELDQFCKRKLSLKFYVRYMDDSCIVVKSREKAKRIKKLISEFVKEKLDIRMNKKKTKIFPINQGINIVGYKIHPTHMLLRARTKKKIKQKCKKFENLLQTKQIKKEKVEQILNSWKGHADHANSYNFFEYLKDRFDYIYTDEKESFKVNLKEVG